MKPRLNLFAAAPELVQPLIDLATHAGPPREAQRTSGQPNWTTRELIAHHRNP